MTAQQIINMVVSWVQQAIGIALLVLIAGTVVRILGVRIPALSLPATSPTELAYICGAWWLYRGARSDQSEGKR